MAFSTVFQAFLTTFLIDSGYKKPIQNKDELYESGIKLFYPLDFSFIIENGDEMEVSKVQNNRANCPSYWDCIDWAKYHKNVSILFPDFVMKFFYAVGVMLSENSKPLMCRIEDGVVYNDGIRMIMLQGDPLMRRVTGIIDRVVEAGIYNYWKTMEFNSFKFCYNLIGIGDNHDGYYSFNLYHMQPAFYLLLMGWCLSALSFIVELFYNWVLNKKK